jgi:hypothetical protein
MNQLIFTTAAVSSFMMINKFVRYGLHHKEPMTNRYVSGQVLRNTKNEYYAVVNHGEPMKNHGYFIPFNKISSMYLYDSKYYESNHFDYSILRLNFEDNKEYFIESNQDISVDNPSMTFLSRDEVLELIKTPPKFVILPVG